MDPAVTWATQWLVWKLSGWSSMTGSGPTSETRTATRYTDASALRIRPLVEAPRRDQAQNETGKVRRSDPDARAFLRG
jgi:hypothetical protein